jgi:hypothetical protein
MGYDSDEESEIEHGMNEELATDPRSDGPSVEESDDEEIDSSPASSQENIPPNLVQQFPHGLLPGYALHASQLMQQVAHFQNNLAALSQVSLEKLKPRSNPSKRPSSSENLEPPMPNKRHSSLGAISREERALQEKIFGNKAMNVGHIETFTLQEDLERERDEPDVKVPKAELEWLIKSIPLEDRVKGDSADINETVMVFDPDEEFH